MALSVSVLNKKILLGVIFCTGMHVHAAGASEPIQFTHMLLSDYPEEECYEPFQGYTIDYIDGVEKKSKQLAVFCVPILHAVLKTLPSDTVRESIREYVVDHIVERALNGASFKYAFGDIYVSERAVSPYEKVDWQLALRKYRSECAPESFGLLPVGLSRFKKSNE